MMKLNKKNRKGEKKSKAETPQERKLEAIKSQVQAWMILFLNKFLI